MTEKRTIIEWRRSTESADLIYDEVLNRLDYLLPMGQTDIGDEMRSVLRIAYMIRHSQDRFAAKDDERVLSVLLELLARVETEAANFLALDAWVESWRNDEKGNANA